MFTTPYIFVHALFILEQCAHTQRESIHMTQGCRRNHVFLDILEIFSPDWTHLECIFKAMIEEVICWELIEQDFCIEQELWMANGRLEDES